MKTRNEVAQSFLRDLFSPQPHGTAIELRWAGPGGVKQEFVPSPDSVLVDRFDAAYRVWFGAALRKDSASRGDKKSVAAVTALWADVDSQDSLDRILRNRPTLVVASGGGFHAYWKLVEPVWVADDPDRMAWVERALRSVTSRVGGDPAACDIARVMGLPGTWNAGDGKRKTYDPPVLRQVVYRNMDSVYRIEDLAQEVDTTLLDSLAPYLSPNIRKLVIDGWYEGCGYATRSEADMAVAVALVSHGLNDDSILKIFDQYRIGEKYREKKDGLRYLKRTIERARAYCESDQTPIGTVAERSGTLCVRRPSGWVMVYNSTMRPVYKVVGRQSGWIVEAAGQPTFIRSSAFASSRDLKRALQANGAWFGNDQDVQRLIPFFESFGVPQKPSVDVVGWDDDKESVVFPNAQLLKDGTYVDSPEYLYVGSHPELRLHPPVDDYMDRLRLVVDILTSAQSAPRVMTAVGWFLASLAAPFVREMSPISQFPILLVYGEREAGKTSILDVLSRMVGALVPETANITPWALVQAIGSANAVPVWLDEFRSDAIRSKPAIASILRSAYNAKFESRGRPNLEVQRVRLVAPVAVSGEAPWSDPALLDRTLAVRLFRSNLKLQDLHKANVAAAGLNGSLFRHVIMSAGRMEQLWGEAQAHADRLPSDVSHRVRHAHAVAAFGLRLFGFDAGCVSEIYSEDRPEVDMPDYPVLYEAMRAVAELVRVGRLREGVDFLLMDNRIVLFNTALAAVEEYYLRFPTELPITRHTVRQQIESALSSGRIVEEIRKKIAGRWGYVIRLDEVESEMGIPRSAYASRGNLSL